MRDILFLFGAGASFGAGSILPEQPPLGSRLFEQLKRVYPGTWGALPEEISAGFASGNFEVGMGAIYETLGGAIPQLMREMAIYFIQFRPFGRSTLYCRLLGDLERLGVLNRSAFSTLNYECVLEFSALAHGLAINYFDPPDPARLPVWKLHGSCNMFSKDLKATPGIYYGTGVTFDGGVEAFLDSNRVVEHCLVETALAPVMSLYMEGKPINVCPSAVSQVQRLWAAATSRANAVVCIGVKPWPADTHIWSVLSSTPAELCFIGGREEYLSWSADRRTGPTEFLGRTFGEAYWPLIRKVTSYATQ